MMGVVYDRYVYKLLNDILKMKKYPYDLRLRFRSRNNSNLDTQHSSSVQRNSISCKQFHSGVIKKISIQRVYRRYLNNHTKYFIHTADPNNKSEIII